MQTSFHVLAPHGSLQVINTPERYFNASIVASALQTASQHQKSTLVVQFLKGGINQGCNTPVHLGEHFTWMRPSVLRGIHDSFLSCLEKQAITEVWRYVQQHLQNYELVVLEEVGLAVEWGFIEEAELLQLVQKRPLATDLVLVGTDIPASLRTEADEWTEVRTAHPIQIAA